MNNSKQNVVVIGGGVIGPGHGIRACETRSAGHSGGREGNRLGGFLELSGVNMKILPRRINALRAVAGRYLEKVPEGKTEEHWTGMRACSSDGVPIIGKLPGVDNAWVGTGHWHFGLTLAPPTALMLAELITMGSSSVNAKPFDPARF